MNNRKIKLQNKTINFNYEGHLKAKEVVAVENCIKGAYELAQKSLALIKSGDGLEDFEAIFGALDAFKQKKAGEAYLAIVEKIESGEIVIVRAKQFVSKARQFEPETFSSATPDGKTIRIYDAFFKEHEGDSKNLNDRSSVIMHEVAHLVGLTGDCETDSVKSAECLRNFTILACGIVAQEDLFGIERDESEEEIDQSKDSKVGINGDLPYNSDQPRHPKGQSNGGQWAPKEGGDGASSGSGNKNAQKQESEKRETPKDTFSSKSEEPKDKMQQNNIPLDKKIPNAKSILNLQDKGVKASSKGNWCAGNLTITGLDVDEKYTVIVEIEYEVTNPETGKSHTETEKIAIDVKSNAKGEVSITRMGILGEYNTDPRDNKFQVEDHLKIKVDVSVAEGTVADNFKEDDEVDKGEDKNEKSTGNGMGYYSKDHAKDPQWVDSPNDDEYNGNSVKDKKYKKEPESLKKVGTSIITYVPDKEFGDVGIQGTTTIEGDTLNTAKGRGGHY